MLILSKLKGYLLALGGFLVMILGTYFLGRFKGDQATKKADEAGQVKAQAEAIQKQTQTRQEVESEVSKLRKPTVPDPLPTAQGMALEPTQIVVDAQPGTAADELRKQFMRET